jgi:hypothetical protein
VVDIRRLASERAFALLGVHGSDYEGKDEKHDGEKHDY